MSSSVQSTSPKSCIKPVVVVCTKIACNCETLSDCKLKLKSGKFASYRLVLADSETGCLTVQ